MRFVVTKEQVSEVTGSSNQETDPYSIMSAFFAGSKPSHLPSVSIATLLEAGKLIQPSPS